jgi:two-component system sensor histidine kinase YesM
MLKNRINLKVKLVIVVFLTLISLYGIIVLVISLYITPPFRTDAVGWYKYHNTALTESFNKLCGDIDSITGQIITDPEIQNSLEEGVMTDQNKQYISDTLKRYLTPPIENMMFIGNDGSIISAPTLSPTDLKTIMSTDIYTNLADSYAKPNINVENDRIFMMDGEKAFFVSNNIHHLSINVHPGVLIYKLNWEDVLDEIGISPSDPGTTVLLNRENKIVYTSSDLTETQAMISDMKNSKYFKAYKGTSWFFDSDRFYIFSQDPRSGWTLANIVSNQEMLSGIFIVERQLFIIISIVILICISLIFFFTSWIIRPIENDIRRGQEQLRQAELNSLIYQINPHLLYNTLDNIYMMARVSGDRNMYKLIEALSRFLRISISKGENFITVQKEFEHVSSYLTIQKIRYGELFEYETVIDEEISLRSILKLILQPVVENSIKHGFADMQTGGLIKIIAKNAASGRLEFVVTDNGCGMPQETIDRINSIKYLKDLHISKIFGENDGGYGVANVIARLRLYYGENFDFSYSNEDGTTVCRILLGSLR